MSRAPLASRRTDGRSAAPPGSGATRLRLPPDGRHSRPPRRRMRTSACDPKRCPAPEDVRAADRRSGRSPVTASLFGRACQPSSTYQHGDHRLTSPARVHASLRSRLGESRRCTHWSDWEWRATLLGALAAQQSFAASSKPPTLPLTNRRSVRFYCGAKGAFPQRKSAPSTHIRCRMTASFRATAMTAL